MKVGGECVGGKKKGKAGRDTDLYAGRCIDSGQRVGGAKSGSRRGNMRLNHRADFTIQIG